MKYLPMTREDLIQCNLKNQILKFFLTCWSILALVFRSLKSQATKRTKELAVQRHSLIVGTSLGGGTLWGLLGLLTDAKDYDEMLEMSKRGDNSNVDMLVGDIYGGDYSKIGLKSTTIASSFGKVIKVPPAERKGKFKQEDVAVSLLYLVRYHFVFLQKVIILVKLRI